MGFLKGRMNRARFWLGVGAAIILSVVAYRLGSPLAYLSEVILIALCIPRLHDIGLSGWYVLIGLGIEAGGIFVALAYFSIYEAGGVIGIAALVVMALIVLLGCIKGDPEPNKWDGPPGSKIADRDAGPA